MARLGVRVTHNQPIEGEDSQEVEEEGCLEGAHLQEIHEGKQDFAVEGSHLGCGGWCYTGKKKRGEP